MCAGYGIYFALNALSNIDMEVIISICLILQLIALFYTLKIVLVSYNNNNIEVNDNHVSSGKFRTIPWAEIDWNKSKLSKYKTIISSAVNPSSNKVIIYPFLYEEDILSDINKRKTKKQ